MDLNVLWFLLITVLYIGFFVLEGFDFGVGMLVSVIGKKDVERRQVINAIGPVWDANEVWLLTAGGATFAAFPGWYATMFSGFYLALFLVLAALILRGVAFEFRSRVEDQKWRDMWDKALLFGSILPPLLLGVAMVDLVNGIPIDAQLNFAGSFFDLLALPALLGGVMAVAVFLYHGAVFLTLKLQGDLLETSFTTAKKLGLPAVALAALSSLVTGLSSGSISKPLPVVLAVVAVAALAVSWWMIGRRDAGRAMILNGIGILAGVAAVFASLFPNVMVSSLAPENSLTIYNASSSPYTLKTMTIITLTLLPLVLAYFIWTYWVFRKRVDPKHLEY